VVVSPFPGGTEDLLLTGNLNPLQIAPVVRKLLDALRGRIRWYVWLEGIAVSVAWLALGFWVSLWLDWGLEPPAAIRVAILALVLAGFLGLWYRLIFRRAFARLSDGSMAMLLERRFPQFNESLLTAVELSGRPLDVRECSPVMLGRTCREAEAPVAGVRLGRIFNPLPLGLSLAAALWLVATVAAFGVLAPGGMKIWLRRNVLLSNELWPRRTRLEVVGFPHGWTKVARGDDFVVVARADLRKRWVPASVEIRYRSEEGGRLRATMSREGKPDPAKDKYQEYSHTFAGVSAPIRFDVVGGDDAVRGLRIEVVDSPTIVAMQLRCRYPAYMGRAPRTLPAVGVMQIPRGTEVTLTAKSNKDLVSVQVDSGQEESRHAAELIRPVPGSPREFQYHIASLDEDRALLFTVADTDGIKSREPVRLGLAVVNDEKPQLALQLRGVGSAITAKARLPVAGQVTDDYGVARIWFEYVVDQQPPATVPIRTFQGNPTDIALSEALEVPPLGLKPGQKLVLHAEAADRYNLTGKPNIGQSDRWTLDVVTPEKLRMLLESRELVLRQRFEALIQDVTETRDWLVRVEFDGKPAAAAAQQAKPRPPQQASTEWLLAVERTAQNSQKDARETAGVAESILDIRDELVNNRIDTPELKRRLELQIAAPLTEIVEKMFPDLDRLLDRVQASREDREASIAGRQKVVAQLNRILASMQQVLSRMIELEDFNEAVELLRTIIDQQKQLDTQTKQRHKQKLHELLEK
jgi:hypothetical protein